MTGTRVRSQIHMEDVVIQDNELEGLLEDREEKKRAAGEYKKADKAAKDKISGLDQKPPYRIGRFIIGVQATKAKEVAFETDAGTRTTIKLASE